MDKAESKMSHLFGFATKGDGHKRITKGDNYTLVGGTEHTHEIMQETAEKINEHLKKKSKTLSELTKHELRDIAEKVLSK
jgi:hypothetical protein